MLEDAYAGKINLKEEDWYRVALVATESEEEAVRIRNAAMLRALDERNARSSQTGQVTL